MLHFMIFHLELLPLTYKSYVFSRIFVFYVLFAPDIQLIKPHLAPYHAIISSQTYKFSTISTGERPFIDILQDRRYWVIHLITIPSLFLAGVIFILSGFVYKLFGVANFMRYFYNVPINTQISLINDRFSIFLFIEDV